MGDYIAIGVLVAVITAIIGYLIKKKKSGAKCIGCPYGEQCTKCGCNENENH